MNWKLPAFLKNRFGGSDTPVQPQITQPATADVHLEDLAYCVSSSRKSQPQTIQDIAQRWRQLADLLEENLTRDRTIKKDERTYIETVRNVAELIAQTDQAAETVSIPIEDLDYMVNRGNIAARANRLLIQHENEKDDEPEQETGPVIGADELAPAISPSDQGPSTRHEPLSAFAKTGRGTLDPYSSSILPIGYTSVP